MAEVNIYGIPGSPFMRAVEIACQEKGVGYDIQVVPPQELKGEEYLRLHPFGRLPVVKMGDVTLYETQAIVRLLDQLYPEPSLTPVDPYDAARMNQVIGINDWYFFPKAAAPIGFQRVIGPILLGIPADEQVVAAAVPMARTCVAELSRLLGARRYFGGNTFSIADAMLGAQMDIFSRAKEGAELLEGTRLVPWLERLRQRPSFRATELPAPFRQAA